MARRLVPEYLMKVGDLVRQNPNNGLIKIKSHKSLEVEPYSIGTVIAIKEGLWPKDWDVTEEQRKFEMRIGRRVDVMWPNGKITENFAEHILVVVEDET